VFYAARVSSPASLARGETSPFNSVPPFPRKNSLCADRCISSYSNRHILCVEGAFPGVRCVLLFLFPPRQLEFEDKPRSVFVGNSGAFRWGFGFDTTQPNLPMAFLHTPLFFLRFDEGSFPNFPFSPPSRQCTGNGNIYPFFFVFINISPPTDLMSKGWGPLQFDIFLFFRALSVLLTQAVFFLFQNFSFPDSPAYSGGSPCPISFFSCGGAFDFGFRDFFSPRRRFLLD